MTPRDLRHLMPPAPLEIILDAVDHLPSGGTLTYLLPHHPAPLLSFLAARGLRFRCELAGDGGVLLTIDQP